MDTSAWIALHEPRDRNHRGARERLAGLLDDGAVLVTGWHTIVELADGLARHYGQREAVREVNRLLASEHLRTERSEPHLERALSIFESRPSWNVDLSDCLSFALMEAAEIRTAFTFDSDFRKAGFGVA